MKMMRFSAIISFLVCLIAPGASGFQLKNCCSPDTDEEQTNNENSAENPGGDTGGDNEHGSEGASDDPEPESDGTESKGFLARRLNVSSQTEMLLKAGGGILTAVIAFFGWSYLFTDNGTPRDDGNPAEKKEENAPPKGKRSMLARMRSLLPGFGPKTPTSNPSTPSTPSTSRASRASITADPENSAGGAEAPTQ